VDHGRAQIGFWTEDGGIDGRTPVDVEDTLATTQSRRASCHAVAAGTTALITQLPLPFDRS
jgi:hypothetical protein